MTFIPVATPSPFASANPENISGMKSHIEIAALAVDSVPQISDEEKRKEEFRDLITLEIEKDKEISKLKRQVNMNDSQHAQEMERRKRSLNEVDVQLQGCEARLKDLRAKLKRLEEEKVAISFTRTQEVADIRSLVISHNSETAERNREIELKEAEVIGVNRKRRVLQNVVNADEDRTRAKARKKAREQQKILVRRADYIPHAIGTIDRVPGTAHLVNADRLVDSVVVNEDGGSIDMAKVCKKARIPSSIGGLELPICRDDSVPNEISITEGTPHKIIREKQFDGNENVNVNHTFHLQNTVENDESDNENEVCKRTQHCALDVLKEDVLTRLVAKPNHPVGTIEDGIVEPVNAEIQEGESEVNLKRHRNEDTVAAAEKEDEDSTKTAGGCKKAKLLASDFGEQELSMHRVDSFPATIQTSERAAQPVDGNPEVQVKESEVMNVNLKRQLTQDKVDDVDGEKSMRKTKAYRSVELPAPEVRSGPKLCGRNIVGYLSQNIDLIKCTPRAVATFLGVESTDCLKNIFSSDDLSNCLRELRARQYHFNCDVSKLWEGKDDAWKKIMGHTPQIKSGRARRDVLEFRLATILHLKPKLVVPLDTTIYGAINLEDNLFQDSLDFDADAEGDAETASVCEEATLFSSSCSLHQQFRTLVRKLPSGYDLISSTPHEVASLLGLKSSTDLKNIDDLTLRFCLLKLKACAYSGNCEVLKLWDGKDAEWKSRMGPKAQIRCNTASRDVYEFRLKTILNLKP